MYVPCSETGVPTVQTQKVRTMARALRIYQNSIRKLGKMIIHIADTQSRYTCIHPKQYSMLWHVSYINLSYSWVSFPHTLSSEEIPRLPSPKPVLLWCTMKFQCRVQLGCGQRRGCSTAGHGAQNNEHGQTHREKLHGQVDRNKPTRRRSYRCLHV